MKYLSHPDRLLRDHINGIACLDKSDKSFVESAFFHDLGKVREWFQEFIKDTDNFKGDKHSHSDISAIIYLLQKGIIQFKDSKEVLFVFNSIISHHGKLNSFYSKNSDKNILNFFAGKKISDKKSLEEVLSKKDVKEFFNIEIDLNSLNLEKYFFKMRMKNKDLSFTIKDFIRQKELFSKLIFADKYDAIFKKDHEIKSDSFELKDLFDFKNKNLTYDKNREQVRKIVLENFNNLKKEKIFLLTAPTGIGKTLLSLELALKIKSEKGLKKIIYLLPFTSIIDQTYSIFNKIFPSKITTHHYKVTYNNNENELDYDRWKFLLNSWDDSFVISTFYQFCFAIFSNKNSDSIKFQALKNSIVILDEVQAIPFEFWKIFNTLLTEISENLNTHFILMSATMPIVVDSKNELADKENFYKNKNRYKFIYDDSKNLDEICNKILKQYRQGKSVVCVINTIKNCKLLFKKIKSEVKSTYCLNSYILHKNRKEIITQLTGGHGNKVKNKILISTQVIEAGVDLDFDVGFRELSPIYSMIQTAGRVNRENINKQSSIYIFDSLTNIYESQLMAVTKKYFFNELKHNQIEEQSILKFLDGFFKEIHKIKSSAEIIESISRFDFDNIARLVNKSFGTDKDYLISTVIGLDLNIFEKKYFDSTKNISDIFEKKKKKKKIISGFSQYILNIKDKDLFKIEKPKFSEIFGLYYFENAENIYIKESGFKIIEELEEKDFFI